MDPRNNSESPDITLRPISTYDEGQKCADLQKETWGEDFTDVVPPSLLMITQTLGGVAVGAYDSSDRLVGFVVGFSGIRDGRLVHWSDMLAVRPEMSGKGIGRRLKEYQRRFLLDIGIETVLWTFDPLVARNAHFNFNRLGARPSEYVIDMYGTDTGSVLHSGLGTDRFIMQWNLEDPIVEIALRGEHESAESTETVNAVNTRMTGGIPQPVDGDLTDAPVVQIEIPDEIHEVKSNAPEVAMAWRTSTRRAFKWYMENNYSVVGFRLENESRRGLYTLRKNKMQISISKKAYGQTDV